MNKNRIEGRYDGTSWHNTAKSCGLVVEVNAAVVSGSNAFLPMKDPTNQEGCDREEDIQADTAAKR